MNKIHRSKEVLNSLKELKVGESRQIEQYDLEGNLIKVWDTVGECAKQFSKCREVAKGIKSQTKGYVFKYRS